MKNARRSIALAAVAAAALATAPSALADVRIHVNLPVPPPPHEVLKHLPAPPPPPVVHLGYRHDRGERWNYEKRHRNDHWRNDRRYRDRARWAYVEGHWVRRPFRGAVWVDGYYDRWGRWVPGYWTKARYR